MKSIVFKLWIYRIFFTWNAIKIDCFLNYFSKIFQLWLSLDHGQVWIPIHQFVKAFFWSSNRMLLVERTEPSGANTIMKLDMRTFSWFQRGSSALRLRLSIRKEFVPVIQNVQDFQIRGDYMFATMKNLKVNIMVLHVESFARVSERFHFRLFLFFF